MPDPDSASLRLVTINTWKCEGDYGARLLALERQLAALAPDVIALQESFATVDGRLDTATRLGRRLGMAVSFLPERRKLREVEGRLLDSYSGLAVLTRETAVEQTSMALPSSAEDGGRSAQLLRWRHEDKAIIVGNVHLSHLPHGAALRQRQLGAVLAHPWFAADAAIAIACGDFNAALSSFKLRGFLDPPWRWRDACASIVAKRTHRSAPGDGDLDHVLVRYEGGPLQADATLVLDAPDPDSGVAPSDHRGVEARFRWRR